MSTIRESSTIATSRTALPNLPGMRRDISKINPKMYKEYQNSLCDNSMTEGDSFYDIGEEFGSTYNEDRLQELSRALTAFPNETKSFNDSTGRYSMLSQKEDRERNIQHLPYNSMTGPLKTTYVTADNTSCAFVAYFTESFTKEIDPQSRKVIITFYLSDKSIEISEPRVENSGGPSGKFLKRHKILKPVVGPKGGSAQGASEYSLEDFYSGAEIILYNRSYYIIDCDLKTRKYMESKGCDFGPPKELPSTIYDPTLRPGVYKKAKSKESKSKDDSKSHGVTGFFQYDRKVLRFFGQWDCRDVLFGDDLRVKLHYTLADNKLEIVPLHERNSGRDKQARLLKRGPIMKPRYDFMETVGSTLDTDSLAGYTKTGVISSGSMLALLGEGPGVQRAEPYHWTDLKIGLKIPVAALTITLIDADEFTREFYQSKEMPLDAPINPAKPEYPQVSDEPPPPLMAVPTKTKEEGIKAVFFMGQTLKFKAVFLKPKEADKTRQFVITYFMENDTVQIMEPQIRNSGHKGGLFLRRTRLTEPIKPEDLWLGTSVTIAANEFAIIDADKSTLKFMESYPDSWQGCNLKLIKKKLQPRKEVLLKEILFYPGLYTAVIEMPTIQKIFDTVYGEKYLVKQETKTVFRHIDPFHTNKVNLSKFLTFVKEEV